MGDASQVSAKDFGQSVSFKTYLLSVQAHTFYGSEVSLSKRPKMRDMYAIKGDTFPVPHFYESHCLGPIFTALRN